MHPAVLAVLVLLSCGLGAGPCPGAEGAAGGNAKPEEAKPPWVGKSYKLAMTKAGKPAGTLDVAIGPDLLTSAFLSGKGFTKLAYAGTKVDLEGSEVISIKADQTTPGGSVLSLALTLRDEGNGSVNGTCSITDKNGKSDIYQLANGQAPGKTKAPKED